MKVSTFNIKNDFDYYKLDKTKKIYKYFKNNNIDILGLQEVFSKCNNDLKKVFDSCYSIIGKYRFYIRFFFRKCNEKNPIITNYRIIKKRTYHLPFFPSGLKRVMTHIIIDFKGKKISIYNTHLEAKIVSVKEKQLKRIYRIIKKDKYPIILMGDFNLNIKNKKFLNFIKNLEELSITRVELLEKTLKSSKTNLEIDHFFISKEFKLKNKEVVKSLDISDHYPVIIDLEYK